MNFDRAGGILLHPTSLPGRYGIGDLGPQAFRFVDWLASTGSKLWQVLPLGPTGYGDSPYQCFSAFAGNPYLISFDALIEDGLLTEADFVTMPRFSASRVDYGQLIPWKLDVLEKAFSNFHPTRGDFARRSINSVPIMPPGWMIMLFSCPSRRPMAAVHGMNGSKPIRKRENSAMEKARSDHAESILRHSFYQFLFFRQWDKLRDYANERDITIIGDIPIFIAYDSADAWANPELFFLDEKSLPTVVAGVPPDYFSATGQLWGNPLYKWSEHKKTGYQWWINRFHSVLKLVDIIRLDHFRGFAGYYEIPFGSPTAEHGRWVTGPGKDFLAALSQALGGKKGGTMPIIAEDLGVITPDVVELRDSFHLPGMKILQFAFSSPTDPFLPHNYTSNCVAYTGTHDNDTVCGWYETAPEKEREFALRYLNTEGGNFAWSIDSRRVGICGGLCDYPHAGPSQPGRGSPHELSQPPWWKLGMADGEDDVSETLAARLKELNELYLR